MTKNEFIDRFQNLISEYCGNNNEYEDLDDYFDFYYNHCGYTVKVEIDCDDYGKEEEY